jgi:O-antigen/teichoic acid export membrane protein
MSVQGGATAAGVGLVDGGAAADVSTLARRSVLNLVGGVLFGAFGFLALVIVARGLGPARAGTFLEGVAFFTIATSLVVLGTEESMVRAVSRALATGEGHELRTSLLVALVPLLGFAVVAAGAAWAFAPALARVLQDGASVDDLTATLRVFALALPFTAMHFAILAATRGFGTMLPTVAIERVGRTGAQALGAAVVLAAGWRGTSLAIAWIAPFVVGAGAAGWTLRRLVVRSRMRAPRPSPRPSVRAHLRAFWGFSSLRGLASIFQTTFLWLDTLIVGALVSASTTAVYTTSSRMVRLGSLVLLALVQAVAPQISELLARHERARAEHVYRISTWWLMTLTWPLYLTMAVFAPVLLRVFGGAFPVGAQVVATMCGAMLFSTAVGAVDMVLLMAGKSGWNLANSAIALVTNVVGNLLLVPRLGIEGAAIAWAASVVLNNLLPYLEVRVLLGIGPFARPGAIPAVAAVLSFGVIGCIGRLLAGPSISTLIVSTGVGAITYLALLRRLGAPLAFEALFDGLRRRRLPA